MLCCILCCLLASQAVLKRFRRVSAILVLAVEQKNESFNKPKHKIGSERLMLGSRGAREHEGRFKGWGKKTPIQTILFSLFHPSLKPQIWAICVTLSISSSDKGLIARSSVGQCHVKINQSQSIKKHTYIRRSVALSPLLHQQCSVPLYPYVTGRQASVIIK